MLTDQLQLLLGQLEDELTKTYGAIQRPQAIALERDLKEIIKEHLARALSRAKKIRRDRHFQGDNERLLAIVAAWNSTAAPSMGELGAENGITKQRVQQLLQRAARMGLPLRT